MRNFVRQALAMVVGGALVAAVLLGRGAIAQNEPAAEVSEPTQIKGVLSTSTQMSYQGQLFSNGGPVTSDVSVIFRIYDTPSGGNPLWTEGQVVKPDLNGIFSTMLGKLVIIDPGIFGSGDRYLGIAIGADSETVPRQPIGASGYAMFAHNSDRLQGLPADSFGVTKREILAYGVVGNTAENKPCSRVKGHHFSSGPGVVDGKDTCIISIENRSGNAIAYDLNKYVTVVTPIRNGTCDFPMMATTGSRDGKLLVDLYRDNGSDSDQCKFHFQTFAFTTSGDPD